MFKGFMDDAGTTAANDVCVMAGFVGSADECDEIAERWKGVVKPLGDFHGREFFARTPNGTMRGKYKHLSVRDAESCAFELVNLLAYSSLEPIGMVLDTRTFFSLDTDERRWMTSGRLIDESWPAQGAPNYPWFACCHYCLAECTGYTPETERIHLTFDRQGQRQTHALEIYNRLQDRGGSWAARLGDSVMFSSRAEAVLLQAADLLACVIPGLISIGNVETMTSPVAADALQKLGMNRTHVVAMDAHAIDELLRSCPFRSTFWEGWSEPDLLEQIRAQRIDVTAAKISDGVYATHHLKRDRIKIVQDLESRVATVGGRNLTTRQEDSTKKT